MSDARRFLATIDAVLGTVRIRITANSVPEWDEEAFCGRNGRKVYS